MRRGCLFGIIGLLGVCVVVCVLGYFVGLPNVRDAVREPLEEQIGTQVARQISPNGRIPGPGTYVIDADQLNSALQAEITDAQSFDAVTVALAPGQFEVRFTANDQDVTYTGDVAAVDGRLDVVDMSGSGWLTRLLPASDVAGAVETAINGYLTANNLTLTDATLGNGTLTLTTTR